jgi:hypothetical protein
VGPYISWPPLLPSPFLILVAAVSMSAVLVPPPPSPHRAPPPVPPPHRRPGSPPTSSVSIPGAQAPTPPSPSSIRAVTECPRGRLAVPPHPARRCASALLPRRPERRRLPMIRSTVTRPRVHRPPDQHPSSPYMPCRPWQARRPPSPAVVITGSVCALCLCAWCVSGPVWAVCV